MHAVDMGTQSPEAMMAHGVESSRPNIHFVMAVLAENANTSLMAEAQETINRYVEPGLGKERSVQTYNETCDKYDEYTGAFEYCGPAYAAKVMRDLYPDKIQRSRVRILDVAAGTGLVGAEMKKLGFKNMDALDPSKGMMDIARGRGCYNKLYIDFIGEYDLNISGDTYDAIVMSGGMGENMIPVSAFIEMTRIVKPGGFIVNVTRIEHLENCKDYVGNLEPMLDKLQEAGRWTEVDRISFPNFLRGKEGIALIHKVL
ncbi:methyltransferase-like protein 27 [Littorina saxatilis]